MNDPAVVSKMDLNGVRLAIEWADREGWQPGLDDAAPFHAADPDGFFCSREGDRTVAIMSAVRGSRDLAFVGLYIVDPEFRGTGRGKRLWDEVLFGLDEFTLGLDAVPEQVATYRNDGFEPAHGNARYSADALPAPESSDGTFLPATDVDFDSLVDFDGRHCFGPRPEFLKLWIEGPGRSSLVATDPSGGITGFAASRKSDGGDRIGPVFADEPGIARELILTLAREAPGRVAIDVPLPNQAAVGMVESFGMERSFETERMYRGAAPELPLANVFGITSLELG